MTDNENNSAVLQQTAEFVGSWAQLWLYSPTHSQLVILLERAETKKYLVLYECVSVCTPTRWIYRMATLKSDSELGACKFFVSEEDGVEIEFEHMELRDDFPAIGELP